MNPKALITGISGQDGAYLAKHLIEKNYDIVGASRDPLNNDFKNLKTLGIYDKIHLEELNSVELSSVLSLLEKYRFDEIYHLSSQSSVGLSFTQPQTTLNSTVIGTLNFLEGIKIKDKSIKFYHASSSECFGGGPSIIDEKTPFNPKSPYGIGKVAASQIVEMYRKSYSIYAVNGYLFNHESIFRGIRYVTQKIVYSAFEISKGHKDKLVLGNVDIIRDWGWAPEYVLPMHLMLQKETPEDYVIGTGKSYSLRDYIFYAFDYFNLDYKEYLIMDSKLFRPNEITEIYCNPIKAHEDLNWKANKRTPEIVIELCKGIESKSLIT